MELRGMEEWNKIASEIKVVELRKDMLDWGERAEVIIAHKNDRIKMLLDDMEQTQEHHSRSFNKVIELIDHIIECYHAMLESSKRMYDEQAEEVLKEFYDELRFRTEEVDAMHLNSENIIHASNLVARDTLKLDYNIYLEQRDHYVNKDIEARFQIRDSVVRRMSEMQRQLNEFVDSLFNTELDAHKYERIRSLTERQQNFFDETRKLDVEEMKYMGILNDLQRDILRVEAENNTTINDLKLEFEYFANVRKKIEERMHADRITTHEKLRILSTECYQLTKVGWQLHDPSASTLPINQSRRNSRRLLRVASYYSPCRSPVANCKQNPRRSSLAAKWLIPSMWVPRKMISPYKLWTCTSMWTSRRINWYH